MTKQCRSANLWNNWNQRRHGRVIQVDVAPSDGYGRLPYPHVLGPRCFCHPATATATADGDIPVYVHDHPLTEVV